MDALTKLVIIGLIIFFVVFFYNIFAIHTRWMSKFTDYEKEQAKRKLK